MGDKPIWEQTGSSFMRHDYQLFDNDRAQRGAVYMDASWRTWEGQQFQGKAAIVEKWSSLAFQKSSPAPGHRPTSPRQTAASSARLWASSRPMKKDPIMGFHQLFLLKNINDAWVCTNDMFRFALHSFG